MITIKTFYSRNVFKKLLLFDSITPVYCNSFSNNLRHIHREVNERVESRLKSEDSVSKDCRIIYRAPLVTYVRWCYGFTSVTASLIIPTIGTALMTSGIGNYPIMFGDIQLINNSLEFTALVGIMILVTSQINYVVFKYPFRIYQDSSNGKYIAIYQHLLPWKKHKEEFKAGEMKKVVKGFSLWKECLYEINKKKAILIENYFYVPQDFNNMLSSNDEENK